MVQPKHPPETFNAAARRGPVFLFFDEVQNLNDRAPQLKSLVDNHAVRVMVTGSSALRIEAGRDSLAGRLATLEIGPLLLREVGGLREGNSPPPFLPPNGWEVFRDPRMWQELRSHGERQADFRRRAFAAFSERGAYPVAHLRVDVPWEDVADPLTQNVILRVIQHDLRLGERAGKETRRGAAARGVPAGLRLCGAKSLACQLSGGIAAWRECQPRLATGAGLSPISRRHATAAAGGTTGTAPQTQARRVPVRPRPARGLAARGHPAHAGRLGRQPLAA